MPSGLSPRNRPGDVQSSPGRMPCSCASSWASAWARRGSPNACWDSSASSARCSALIELSIRCAAAARWASRSTSSSVFCGFSGKNSPCLRMNSANCCSVFCPCAWFASREFRSSSISRIRSTSPGGDVLHRLLHPGEALVQHLPAEQVPDLLVGLAGLGGAPVVGVELAHRPAGVRRERVELHLAEAGVVGVLVGRARCARPPARVPAARGPPAGCRRAGCRAAAGCAAATPGGSGRPGRACPSMPRRSSSRSAARGEEPSMTSRPTASSAVRRSTGGARGSGPSV